MDAPDVSIEVVSCQPLGEAGRWRVTWRVINHGRQPLCVHDAWVPHGRFRGDGHIPSSAVIEPGASSDLSFNVSAHEPPGTVVENTYLILRLDAWRIFGRMRVEFEERPRPIVESVTAQSLQ